MSIEDILVALDDQCHEECREIFDKAQEEAKQILGKAQHEADEMRNIRLDKTRSEAEREAVSIIYSSRLKAKNAVISAREKIAERVLNRAEEELRDLRSWEDYTSILEGLLREATVSFGERIIVHVDCLDKDLAESILKGWGADYEIRNDIETSGGVIVSDGREEVRIVNTVEERLNRARERLRLDVYSILFGEEDKAATGGG
ncbi:MAG: V-type ATP synthase subunit E [Actinomycetota bacterium]|nr:V-type ATP synthase subunit E [Actinomycetota bacterium]